MTNLLRNPSFEDGTRPVASPFISGAWPPDWEVDWYYKPQDAIIGTGSTWALPEMIVIEYIKQFPEIDHLYDRLGTHILKCFWNGAVGFGWKQTNVLPAGRYRFTCPVKPDHWHTLSDGRMVRPSPETSDDWYLASEVYAGIGDSRRDWLDARAVPIGVYTPLVREVNHPGGELTVRFGARGRWPFRNNGWMFDGMVLERIDTPVTEPLPDDTAIVLQPGTLAAMRAVAVEMLNRSDVMHSSLEMFRTELRDMVQMFDHMLQDVP